MNELSVITELCENLDERYEMGEHPDFTVPWDSGENEEFKILMDLRKRNGNPTVMTVPYQGAHVAIVFQTTAFVITYVAEI